MDSNKENEPLNEHFGSYGGVNHTCPAAGARPKQLNAGPRAASISALRHTKLWDSLSLRVGKHRGKQGKNKQANIMIFIDPDTRKEQHGVSKSASTRGVLTEIFPNIFGNHTQTDTRGVLTELDLNVTPYPAPFIPQPSNDWSPEDDEDKENRPPLAT